MSPVLDRGEILHLLGRHHLSPAVRDGAPALAGHGDPTGRCGWEPFFRALEARGLAVVAEGDAEPRLVPRAEAGAPAHRGGGLAEARRFVDALRGRWTP